MSRLDPDPKKLDFGRLTTAAICMCYQAERKLQGNFNQRTIVDVVRKEHVISSEKLTTVFLGANPFPLSSPDFLTVSFWDWCPFARACMCDTRPDVCTEEEGVDSQFCLPTSLSFRSPYTRLVASISP